MPNPTLRDIVNTFTEEELSLTVPIDFQDISANDYKYVNQYNTYLSNGNYQEALNYRTANADILEKYIYDAKKMNYLQTMVINAYLFAKDEKSAVAKNVTKNTYNSLGSIVNSNDIIYFVK